MSSSTRKIQANRKNALKSSGPTSAKGKKHSSRNAIKHGFFSRELPLSDEEKNEFEALTRSLDLELSPTTTLQRVAVQDIAHCIWRCRMASRLEARCAQALMSDTREAEKDISINPAETTGLYTSSPQDLRAIIAWFKNVIREFASSHVIREDWKVQFDRLFGPHFYDSLTSWTAVSHTAILLAEHMHHHAQTFRKPLPKIEGTDRVVVDPLQVEQMNLKIMDLQLRHMQEFLGGWERRLQSSNYAGHPTMDFCPRFYTAAVRDLHRAVDWLWTLKERETNSANNLL